MNENLPEGWTACPPLIVADLIRGVSYEKGEAKTIPGPGLIPLLRATNIAEDVTFADLQYVPDARVSADQRLRPGDVIVAMSSGSKAVVGKAAQLKSPWLGTFGAFCGVLRPHPALDAAFFGLFFQSRYYRDTISQLSAGTSINNLKRDYFDQLRIALPPLVEQRRIVAMVEALLPRATLVRNRLAGVSGLLNRLQQAVLAAACSGQLTEDWRSCVCPTDVQAPLDSVVVKAADRRVEGRAPIPPTWSWVPLADAVVNHDGRRIPVKAKDREQRGGEYPYYGASGIIDSVDGFLFDGDFLLIAEDGANLLSRTTPIAFQATGKFWVNNHAHVVQPREGILLSYLELCLNSLDLQGYVTGTAQPKLTQSALNQIPIALPPTEEQKEIMRRVGDLFGALDLVRNRVRVAQAFGDRLSATILSRALSGRLVPTEAELAVAEGRDYEVASALLERISGERTGPKRTVTESHKGRALQPAKGSRRGRETKGQMRARMRPASRQAPLVTPRAAPAVEGGPADLNSGTRG